MQPRRSPWRQQRCAGSEARCEPSADLGTSSRHLRVPAAVAGRIMDLNARLKAAVIGRDWVEVRLRDTRFNASTHGSMTSCGARWACRKEDHWSLLPTRDTGRQETHVTQMPDLSQPGILENWHGCKVVNLIDLRKRLSFNSGKSHQALWFLARRGPLPTRNGVISQVFCFKESSSPGRRKEAGPTGYRSSTIPLGMTHWVSAWSALFPPGPSHQRHLSSCECHLSRPLPG